MKLCPVCQRCYDDSDSVCEQDKTGLVASRPGPRLIAEKYRHRSRNESNAANPGDRRDRDAYASSYQD